MAADDSCDVPDAAYVAAAHAQFPARADSARARSPADSPSLRITKLDVREEIATDCFTVCLRTFELLGL